jgi:hypothetical protein
MDSIVKFLRPILSRLIGSWVAALAMWLASHYHIILDESMQEQLIAGFIILIFTVGQTLYAIIHRAIDVHFNPKDIASPTLAEKTK